MKVKKTRRQKRKLLLTDKTEIIKPEKMMKSRELEEVECAVSAILDTMPTRTSYREQLEIGIRNRLLVLVQVSSRISIMSLLTVYARCLTFPSFKTILKTKRLIKNPVDYFTTFKRI